MFFVMTVLVHPDDDDDDDDTIIYILGWDDGKIRSFTPEKGKLKYEINDAHSKGVTALATTSDCQRIISGGGEGQVRVWNIFDGDRPICNLHHALKEHKGIVFYLNLSYSVKMGYAYQY
jgi:WD40 repeat protein